MAFYTLSHAEWPTTDHYHLKALAIRDVIVDAMTDIYATVQLPVQIGHNHCGSLRCNVDTGAGGSVMLLHAFANLFPECISTDGKSSGLYPSNNCLTAYNRSTQLNVLVTVIGWKPKGHHLPNQLHTQ